MKTLPKSIQKFQKIIKKKTLPKPYENQEKVSENNKK